MPPTQTLLSHIWSTSGERHVPAKRPLLAGIGAGPCAAGIGGSAGFRNPELC